MYLLLMGSETVVDGVGGPEDTDRWVAENDARGTRTLGDRLAPVGQAKTVRVRKGGTIVTDGPFAEAHEAIGGFDILICDSMDEALRITADHPMARFGAIEVRPFYDWATPE